MRLKVGGWRRSALLLAMILVLGGVIGQGTRLLVWGQQNSPDPDQASLPVKVDEALFSSGNQDFEGVEGPAWQLEQTVGKLVETQRAIVTDPNIPIKAGGQRISDVIEQDEQRRIVAKQQAALAEEKLAQRLINEVIEQETAYYVDLLEQTVQALDKTKASWEQVRRGVRYVNSQTAVNKG